MEGVYNKTCPNYSKETKEGITTIVLFLEASVLHFWRRTKELTKAVALPASVNQLRRASTANHL
jgi:hypothetical protein